jgi:hypothetical protein
MPRADDNGVAEGEINPTGGTFLANSFAGNLQRCCTANNGKIISP